MLLRYFCECSPFYSSWKYYNHTSSSATDATPVNLTSKDRRLDRGTCFFVGLFNLVGIAVSLSRSLTLILLWRIGTHVSGRRFSSSYAECEYSESLHRWRSAPFSWQSLPIALPDHSETFNIKQSNLHIIQSQSIQMWVSFSIFDHVSNYCCH